MLPVSASDGGELSAACHSGQFELSFLSRFQATGDKHLRNTNMSGCRERNLALERVCVVPIYSISEVTVVRYNNGHMPCSASENGRFVIC